MRTLDESVLACARAIKAERIQPSDRCGYAIGYITADASPEARNALLQMLFHDGDQIAGNPPDPPENEPDSRYIRVARGNQTRE